MDVNSLSTLISNIGVPCACLIATFYLWQKETDAHKEEMKNMTDALNNNTQALTKLTDHITGSTTKISEVCILSQRTQGL